MISAFSIAQRRRATLHTSADRLPASIYLMRSLVAGAIVAVLGGLTLTAASAAGGQGGASASASGRLAVERAIRAAPIANGDRVALFARGGPYGRYYVQVFGRSQVPAGLNR